MFRITRQADYGLLLMSALATYSSQRYVSLRELAMKRNLPYRFLVKIVLYLRKAGLIEAQEGAHGGYRLARAPHSILMRDVLFALDEHLNLVPCEQDDRSCQSFCQCNSRGFWHELQTQIDAVLAKTTVADLIDTSALSLKPNVFFKRLIAHS